jgi:hypothetical protein
MDQALGGRELCDISHGEAANALALSRVYRPIPAIHGEA